MNYYGYMMLETREVFMLETKRRYASSRGDEPRPTTCDILPESAYGKQMILVRHQHQSDPEGKRSTERPTD